MPEAKCKEPFTPIPNNTLDYILALSYSRNFALKQNELCILIYLYRNIYGDVNYREKLTRKISLRMIERGTGIKFNKIRKYLLKLEEQKLISLTIGNKKNTSEIQLIPKSKEDFQKLRKFKDKQYGVDANFE